MIVERFPILLLVVTFVTNFKCVISEKELLTIGHPFFDQDIDSIHGRQKRYKERIAVTFPGTKWCGPGNVADGYDDLGKYKETDMCCRDHDNCENIPAGEEKYGLKNDDWFTRLHCDCDKAFHQCLHTVNGTVSNVVGRQYFLVRDKCFKLESPITECIEYQSNILVRRCVKYSYDTTQPKIYQWFDLPLYDIEAYPNLNDEDYYKSEREHHEEQENILLNENSIS